MVEATSPAATARDATAPPATARDATAAVCLAQHPAHHWTQTGNMITKTLEKNFQLCHI
jgi:hypothetical protein